MVIPLIYPFSLAKNTPMKLAIRGSKYRADSPIKNFKIMVSKRLMKSPVITAP
jgi:hypothetical protein